MKKSIATMRALFCLIAAMLLLVSCDEPDKTAAQPQTVRKKITAKAETGSPAADALAASPVQPASAAAAGEKPVLAQVAKPQTPPSIPVPPPEPKEPPPTQVPAAPLLPSQAAATTESSSPTGVKPLTPDGNPQKRRMVADDSQIAALLNIQAPPPYNPKGKVDPFEPLLRDESAAAVVAKLKAKADPSRPKTPLEKIDLGQLKLVAIITALGGNRALVEESSGKGYIIKEGTFIGLNSGKVVGIKADKVLVEEEFEDLGGKSVTQKKEITLPKPPGEL